MALTSGIVGLILVTWAARTSFAQISNCLYYGQTVTAHANYNETITSPNYPSNYDNNLECAWLITVDSSHSFRGYIVKVTFNDFSLEQSSPCDDVLKFYDGMSSVSRHLGSYCGTTHPEVIYSTGPNLYVKFHTDAIYIYRGFSFSFSAVKEEEASGICRPWDRSSTVHRLSGSSGTFFSPDYPIPYPYDARCIWIISVPAGKGVKLKFEDLDLERSSYSCDRQSTNVIDFVKIGNGQDSESKQIAFYCGYESFYSGFPEVHSTGRYMWIKFYSNSPQHWINEKGFKARFEAVDISPSGSSDKCFTGNIYNNDLKLNGSFGTLQSPREPSYYPAGASCDWLITVPEGKIVKLSFDRFELQPSSGSTCTADYVEVFDGKHSYSKSKGKFCGYTIPDNVKSSERYMWVRFRADSSESYYEGFKATYTAEDKPSTSSSAVIIGMIVLIVIVMIVIICGIVCVIKHKQKPSGAGGATMAMSTTTTTASHTTQPGVIHHPPPAPVQPPYQPPVNPYPPPPVGYAPAQTNPTLPVAPSPYPPYPSEPPPPYPGSETVPQYPPPGQSYPWLQNAPAKASAPPQSP
ncbi:dorsal-ventral patterning tolloid-like protein 1 isoform X1 [Oculina patagonica]